MHRLQDGLASSHLIRRFLEEPSRTSAWDSMVEKYKGEQATHLHVMHPVVTLGLKARFLLTVILCSLSMEVAIFSVQTFDDDLAIS
jgi:hypothetical protein